MRTRHAFTDTVELMSQTEHDLAAAMTAAMREGTDLLKADWRGEVIAAGLGNKLANTVRGQTYPAGAASLDPASWVYTKAPVIMDVFDRGATIVPVNGTVRLAIPTANVPRRRRKRMTPVEVEAYFDQDLIVIHGRGDTLLAFVDVLLARSGRGYRPATRRRLAQGRPRKLVLMFILVRQTRLRKRLDLAGIANRAADRWQGLLERRWLTIPDRTARMGRLR